MSVRADSGCERMCVSENRSALLARVHLCVMLFGLWNGSSWTDYKPDLDTPFDWTCSDFDSLLCKLLQGWQTGSFYWQLPAASPESPLWDKWESFTRFPPVSPSSMAWSHISRLGPCAWTSLSMSWRGTTSGRMNYRRRRRPISFLRSSKWKKSVWNEKRSICCNSDMRLTLGTYNLEYTLFHVFWMNLKSLTDFTWRIFWEPKPEEGTWEVFQEVPEPPGQAGAASQRYFMALYCILLHWPVLLRLDVGFISPAVSTRCGCIVFWP